MGYPLPPGVNENRPNFAPPRGSVLPPDARPDPSPPGAEPAPTQGSAPLPGPGPLLPAEAPPTPPDTTPSPAPAEPGAVPQSALIGGNVGPVGSSQERSQLNYLLGGRANAVTELLFAPLLRGTTVSLTADPEGRR
jgi:hypothetical protein